MNTTVDTEGLNEMFGITNPAEPTKAEVWHVLSTTANKPAPGPSIIDNLQLSLEDVVAILTLEQEE